MTKLRPRDLSDLSQSYVLSAQIIDKLTKTVDENQLQDIRDLPPSVFPSEQLFALAYSYAILYERMENQELTASGNIKQSKTIH